MKINIFGSTGVIGCKTLELIDKNFKNIKVNLLCAKSNIKLLKKQINKYQPSYAFLYDLKDNTNSSNYIGKTKILNLNQLLEYLSDSKSDMSVLAVSGYQSLIFLDHIIENTNNLGIASKEAIVSAGHIFKKKKYFKKTNIFPIDSEHFSLFKYFYNNKNINEINKITITASGGPFYKKKFNTLKHVKFSEAINHPKWKMGYKNSIDSATLVNKCLELIEAHYLFDIPYSKLDILVHPQAIVHSVVEYNNFTSHFNLFKNDMKIPILNFLMFSDGRYKLNNLNLNLSRSDFNSLEFENIKLSTFPIYKIFKKIDKNRPENLIKFNIGNEYAINLFKNKIIRYTDICKIIKNVLSLNLYSSLNTIKDIIKYHEQIQKKLQNSKFY